MTLPDPVPAIPSATVLLLRQRDTVEVLMVKRGRGAHYGSALVFPGGKVDADDRAETWDALVDDAALDREERALRIAGWREVFEEAGLLPFDCPVGATGEAYADLVARSGARLPIGDMLPLARWITARTAPKRFDTWFYLAALDGEEASCDGFETVSAEWISPAQALAMSESGERRLLFPTSSQLRRIAGFDSIDAIFAHIAAVPVTPIETQVVERGTDRFVVIPQGVGYDICEERIPNA